MKIEGQEENHDRLHPTHMLTILYRSYCSALSQGRNVKNLTTEEITVTTVYLPDSLSICIPSCERGVGDIANIFSQFCAKNILMLCLEILIELQFSRSYFLEHLTCFLMHTLIN